MCVAHICLEPCKITCVQEGKANRGDSLCADLLEGKEKRKKKSLGQ